MNYKFNIFFVCAVNFGQNIVVLGGMKWDDFLMPYFAGRENITCFFFCLNWKYLSLICK